MTSIISRSFLESMGHDLPPDLAYVVNDYEGRRVITWAEVMEKRRERQRRDLEVKREWGVYPWRAYKLWVGYFDQLLMGGWHAFIDHYLGDRYHAWIDRDRPWLCPMLMKTFPLLLPLSDGREQWEQWKVSFAEQFERRRKCGKPLGVAYIWWNGRDMPRRAAIRAAAEGR